MPSGRTCLCLSLRQRGGLQHLPYPPNPLGRCCVSPFKTQSYSKADLGFHPLMEKFLTFVASSAPSTSALFSLPADTECQQLARVGLGP